MHSLTHTKLLATASTERWLASCFALMASSHPTKLLNVSHHSHPRDFCPNTSTETATDGLTSPKVFALFNPKTVLCVTKEILHHAAMQDRPSNQSSHSTSCTHLSFGLCFWEAQRLGFVEEADVIFDGRALYWSHLHHGGSSCCVSLQFDSCRIPRSFIGASLISTTFSLNLVGWHKLTGR